jgi:hypothetical protein
MELVFGFPHVLTQELKPVQVALLILGVYVAGQAVATPAKFLLEDFFVDKVLKWPSVNLFRTRPPLLGRILFPGFFKPLPPSIQERIVERATARNAKLAGDELFLGVRYDPEVRKDEKLVQKLDSFRDKYGFNRNLSFTALLLGVTLLVKARLSGDPNALRYGLLGIVAGIMLFYRYLKFFRQYSYEMFNAYGGLK